MGLCGKSLEELFQANGKKFSLKTVCQIGEQLVHRLEFLHSKGVVHRDIKPDNFVVGVGADAGVIHVVDFGLSKLVSKSRHLPFSEQQEFTGTARYSSINAHVGEQSRRDDLEAVGYVLMYFLRGGLPWQGIVAETEAERMHQVMLAKMHTAPPEEDLCAGYPEEFFTFLAYCRSLRFEEAPDYAYLRGLLRQIAEREGFPSDGRFDWTAADAPEAELSGALINPAPRKQGLLSRMFACAAAA
mmetsp:Transcript_54894/g.126107  ORF Transcript_54894/g.126107 Transcript_54894/m.126107 type:complete len:243 (-) Transcript_54894:241-969(-)